MFRKKLGFVLGIMPILGITNPTYALSIAAGDTTQNYTVIWTKTEQADNVLIEYSIYPSFRLFYSSYDKLIKNNGYNAYSIKFMAREKCNCYKFILICFSR